MEFKLTLLDGAIEDQTIHFREFLDGAIAHSDVNVVHMESKPNPGEMGLGVLTHTLLITTKGALATLKEIVGAISTYVNIYKQRIVVEANGKRIEIESNNIEKSTELAMQLLKLIEKEDK